MPIEFAIQNALGILPSSARAEHALGLGQYAQRFAENDISFSILSDLTDQDLKEIGVSLPPRRPGRLGRRDVLVALRSAPEEANGWYGNPLLAPLSPRASFHGVLTAPYARARAGPSALSTPPGGLLHPEA